MALVGIKTVTITEKGQIAIPKDMRELGGFSIGSKIALLTFNDRIELRPMKQISKKMFSALASEKSLAKDWLSKEDDKAWKNL
jgi:AbrB family looped-hinge helix DNA binding protein